MDDSGDSKTSIFIDTLHTIDNVPQRTINDIFANYVKVSYSNLYSLFVDNNIFISNYYQTNPVFKGYIISYFINKKVDLEKIKIIDIICNNCSLSNDTSSLIGKTFKDLIIYMENENNIRIPIEGTISQQGSANITIKILDYDGTTEIDLSQNFK